MKLGEISYALQRGFIGHIKSNFRGIAIKLKDNTIIIRVYLETEPQELDYEIVKTAASEAESLMTEINDLQIELFRANGKISDLQMLDFWFYMRYENDYD